MRKIISLFVFFYLFSWSCIAQSPEEKNKVFNHYIGLQANFLLKQILNFEESDSIHTNPYLLTYGLYHAKSGWGFSAATGFDIRNVSNISVPGGVSSKYRDFYFRIGPGREVKLGKKFETGFNIDFVYNIHSSTSFSSLVTDFGLFTDSTATNIKHDLTETGIGVLANLAFHLTENVLIGTETAFYGLHLADKKNISVYTIHANNIIPGNTESTEITIEKVNTDTYRLNAPVAFFLIVKL